MAVRKLALAAALSAALSPAAALAGALDPATLAMDPYVAPADLDAAQLAELCLAVDSSKALHAYAVETALKAEGTADFAEAAKTMVGLKGAVITDGNCLATIQAAGFVRGAYVEALLLTCTVSEFLSSPESGGWVISNVDPATCVASPTP